ncbi:uncharacterized protein N7500_003051 [Penicillium coprophilum]|uniref:uncharacterized protein n=1 Tax=Penicillium coprophilum TaxID=36646 RepID=UPI0023A13724|nr:uncharacterized protein N7500_003051 [Penicillium coprophilum]KAJ5170268.1 hypothetical protein N7500_003051 [Penicillium coprophilum]
MNFPREPWTGRLPGAGTPVQGQKRSPPFAADSSSKRKRAKAQCGFTDSTWLNVPYDTIENCLTCLDKHPRKPELHLLQEDGEHLRSHPLPRVTLIKVHQQKDLYTNMYSPPLKIHHFRNFITSCPNLKSCSWVVSGYEASNGQTPSDFEGFDIPKPLPSLEHLALDGHYLGSAMWHGWEADFNWSSLSSLEVSGLFVLENIKLMTGRLINLKHLKVIGSDVQNEELCRSLEHFLVLFDTLVDLEILNCFVPLHVIARHTRLVNLCVHIGDTWNCLDSRLVLSNDDLISLDTLCPRLENLELDIERENGTNEWAVLDTLARGFSNLKTLALHSRIGNLVRDYSGYLGLYEECHFFEPELTYKTAKEIGSNFFATRRREFNPSSESPGMSRGFGRLLKLTLKAGLNKGLPCPKRWKEMHYEFNTLTFDMLPPRTTGEAPELVHLERENQEKKCRQFSDPLVAFHLRLKILIAEEGSRFVPTRNPYGSKVVCKFRQRVPPRRSERLARRRAMESVD